VILRDKDRRPRRCHGGVGGGSPCRPARGLRGHRGRRGAADATAHLLRSGQVHNPRALPRGPGGGGDHPPLLRRAGRGVHPAPLRRGVAAVFASWVEDHERVRRGLRSERAAKGSDARGRGGRRPVLMSRPEVRSTRATATGTWQPAPGAVLGSTCAPGTCRRAPAALRDPGA
jgi:hypothetical protein